MMTTQQKGMLSTRDTIEELQKNLKFYRKVSHDKTEQYNKLWFHLRSVEEDKHKLLKLSKETERTLQERADKISELSLALSNRVENYHEHTGNCEKNTQDLQSTVDALKSALNLKETECGRLIKEKQEMSDDVRTIKTNLERTKTNLERTEAELESSKTEKEDLSIQVRALDSKKEQLDSELHVKDQQLRQKEEVIRALENSLESQTKETQTMRAGHVNQMVKAWYDLKKNNQHMEVCEKKTQDLQSKVDSLTSALNLQETECGKLRKLKQEMSNDANIVNTNLERSKAELERTKTNLERTKAELERSNTNLERTKAELERTKTNLERTKAELESSKTEKEDLSIQVRALDSKQEQLDSDLHVKDQQLREKEEVIRDLKNSLESQTKETQRMRAGHSDQMSNARSDVEKNNQHMKVCEKNTQDHKDRTLSRFPGGSDAGVVETRRRPTAVQADARTGIRLMKVVCGSFHQGSPRFKYGGVQCMAIAAVSLAKHTITSVFSWERGDLDHTLVLGDKVYTDLVDVHNFIHPSQMLSVPDLPAQLTIGEQVLWFTPGDTLSGDIDVTEGEFIEAGVFVSLRNGLEMIFSQYSTCLLTMCVFTSAIVCENGRFAVVDSHSRSKLGLAHGDGTSVALQFACLDDLHHYICCLAQCFGARQKLFELCGFTIEPDA